MVTIAKKNGRVIPAAMILGMSSLISRIVGLARERVLTTTFGAGDVFDAFVAAFRIPDLIFNLVVLGALSAAFIPLFTEKLVKEGKDRKPAFDFALAVLNVVLIAVVVLGVVFFFAAPYVMRLVAPGFAGDKLELTIKLSRVMALQPILLAISFVWSGVLNSFKRFVVYALAPILYNIGIIIGVFFFVPFMGPVGLAWGVVLGAALHMAVQLPSVIKLGFKWRPAIPWTARDMRKLFSMTVPRVFGLAAMQINLLTVTVVGSSLMAGSITVFYLASNIQHLPIGIFGIAFAQAAFPTLAEQVVRGRKSDFKETLVKTFRYILFLVVPVSLYLFLLRAQVVRVLFGDGAFDWEDTILTFETLGWLAISIFAQALIPLLARAFYVQHNTVIPVLASLVSITVNVAVAVWLVMYGGALKLAVWAGMLGAPERLIDAVASWGGIAGLAVAFSLASVVQLVILLGILHWRLKGFNDRQVIVSIVRITGAALAGAVAVQILKYPIAFAVDMQRFWGVLIQLMISGLAGIVVYLFAAWLMGSEELKALKKYMPKKVRVDLPEGTDTPRFEGLND